MSAVEATLTWCPELGVYRLVLYGSSAVLTPAQLGDRIATLDGRIRAAAEEWQSIAEDNPDVVVEWQEVQQ